MPGHRYSLCDRLIEQAAAFPGAKAFIVLKNGGEEESVITWRQLLVAVQSLAGNLAERQLREKNVLLVYQDITQFIIAFLASQYAGIIPVPVSYVKGKKQVTRLLSIMNDASARAILCCEYSLPDLTQGLAGYSKEAGLTIIPTDHFLSTGMPAPVEPASASIALIQYTSGSTGNPKGVVVTSSNLLDNQELIKNTFGCTRSSILFSWLPFHHDMGLIGNILHTVYVGCTCILMSPFQFMQQPKTWIEGISRYKATHSGGPDFAYALCADRISEQEIAAIDLSGWQVAYNGSEPVRLHTLQRFAARFKSAGFNEHAFYPCYGLAEATLLVSGQKRNSMPALAAVADELNNSPEPGNNGPCDASAHLIVSAGAAARGMEIKIINVHDQTECAESDAGEICIAGPGVTHGYWNKNSAGLFYQYGDKQFLRTGDLGFLRKGELFVHGRIKEMLIIRGKNIYPNDIEDIIAETDTAIEPRGVAVFSLDINAEKVVIAAEIKRKHLRDLDPGLLIRTIDRAVTGAGISAYDIILIAPFGIPRTTSGKLQRIQCKTLYEQQSFSILGSMRGLAAGKGEYLEDPRLVQAVLTTGDAATIRKYVLNLIATKTGHLLLQDNNDQAQLTEIGIDSLRAMELINIINRDLEINIEASYLFRENSLTGLIDLIETMLWLKTSNVSGKEIMI